MVSPLDATGTMRDWKDELWQRERDNPSSPWSTPGSSLKRSMFKTEDDAPVKEEEDEPRYWVCVRQAQNGELLTELDIGPTDTVLEVGKVIMRKASLPCRPTLLFDGAVLDIADTVAARGIGNNATIMASLPQAIVTASRDCTAKLWNADTGLCEKTLRGHTDAVHGASFSPDGGNVVTASQDRTARIWNASSGTCKWILRGHTDVVNSATYAAHGKWVVTTSADHTAKIWVAKNGTLMTTLIGHESDVFSAHFKDIDGEFDGVSVTTVSRDGTTRVWNAKTGVVDRTLPVSDEAYTVSFSPDGTLYASAPGDDSAQIFDVETCKCQLILEGHDDQVMSVAFAPPPEKIK